ncbi:unnamed protein product [Aureobasidium uvarum]|uniref:Uncharacterized protein n=1 Tax=Aureobasidium uvarum TaxID=2773716 RepID=A0A9N8KHL6_9PEZI|nr:unnamed protein product [Aureobasidium uvarum]
MDSTTSPSPPPMTTRQQARTARPRLKYVVQPPILDASERQPIKIKESLRTRFDNLCEEAGWTPTNAVRDELIKLTKLDNERKLRDCEAALFAFVQHLDFVWNSGWVLLGRKKFDEGVLYVWYRPIYGPRRRLIEFSYGSSKTVFKPVELKDRVDKDKVWLPFTKLFDLTNLSRDSQNLYLTGVYEILKKFTYMRCILDPNGPEDAVVRHGHPQLPPLPFKPGSVWLRQQGVIWVDDSPKSQYRSRRRLTSPSPDELNADTHVDNDKAYQDVATTASGVVTEDTYQRQTRSSTGVNDISRTRTTTTSTSSLTEIEEARGEKAMTASNSGGSPSRKRVHNSNTESESSSINTARQSTPDRLQSLCQKFQWTPSKPILREIRDLLQSVGLQAIGMEDAALALLAFVQHFDFVWENDFVFVGSRKAQGAQHYERIWYKISCCDGLYQDSFTIDAGRRPCSPSLELVEVEYFWPSFNDLFNMENLKDINGRQQCGFIIGTYLILLEYPALRRQRAPGSGIGIQLATRSEDPDLPFLPPSSSDDKLKSHQVRQSSSSKPPSKRRRLVLGGRGGGARWTDETGSERANSLTSVRQHPSNMAGDAGDDDVSNDSLFTRIERPVTDDQRRQNDAPAKPLANLIEEPETQHKTTESSGHASTLDTSITGCSDMPTANEAAGSLIHAPIITKTLKPTQQSQDQDFAGSFFSYLLRNVQTTSFVDTASSETRLRLKASLPASLFQSSAFGFSPIASLKMVPTLPPRHRIIQELEMIAMGRSDPQQRVTRDGDFAPTQKYQAVLLPAPVASMVREPEKSSTNNSFSSITIDQAIEVLRRPRAKLLSSGTEKDGGLELFDFEFTFPSAAVEKSCQDLKFSSILSVETLPIYLTKSQAFRALAESAREDEEL